MANTGLDLLLKMNNKLEAFLKRNLDVDCVERIRTYEACIVCSERDDKAFKYVVLSDEWLYLAENPPKKLEETVHLRDIVSIQLVSDFPAFLSGEERENTQHIVVTYVTVEASKTMKKKQNDLRSLNIPKTPRSSRGISARSSLSASGHSTARDLLKRDRQFSSFSARELSDKERRVKFEEEISPNVKRKVISMETSSGIKRSNSVDGRIWKEVLDKRAKNKGRPLPQFPQEEINMNGQRPSIPELKLDLQGICGSDDDDDDNDYGKNADMAHLGLPSSLGARSQSSGSIKGSCESEDETEEDNLREGILHLYILSKSSPILMLVQCAWDNYLLRCTLEEDPDYKCRRVSFESPRKIDNKEKMERLFSELKKEILDAGDDMEKTFSVVSELRDGVERKFRLKKLFWKTPELFDYLIKQLLHYLPESSNPQATINDDEAKKLRADELDLAILLAEAIAVMFRETEIVPTRIASLNSGAGSVVGKLLFAMTTQPEVPQKGLTISNKLHPGKVGFEQQRCLVDIELAKLVQEFTNTATSVLFELILIAQQNIQREGCFFNIDWMLKTLNDLDTLENYVERMVAHIMRLLSPSQFDELPPLSVVLVFQQFTVLQCFMEYSPNITKFVRKHFYEEFKYYIQTPILKKKIPSRYPLTPYIFRLIETVVSEVLQKPRQIKS